MEDNIKFRDGNPRIFILDDSKESLDIIESIFKSEDYSLITCQKAADAVTKISEARPHLILLDVMLEDGSGIEVAKKLRESSHSFQHNIIFITADDSKEVIIEAFNNGAVDYVKKPFIKEELKLKIRNHLFNLMFHEEMADVKRMELFKATIISLNHNINTSLTKCHNGIYRLSKEGESPYIDKIQEGVNEIVGYLKKLTTLIDSEINFKEYAETEKMLDLDKK